MLHVNCACPACIEACINFRMCGQHILLKRCIHTVCVSQLLLKCGCSRECSHFFCCLQLQMYIYIYSQQLCMHAHQPTYY